MNHFVNRYSFKTAMHRSKIILVILASFIFMEKAKAQGCSDAGICSARGINSANKTDSLKNQIGVSFSYAIGEQGTKYLIPQLEPQIRISDRSMVLIKIPFMVIKSPIANTSGLGDVILNYTIVLDSFLKHKFSFTLGTRIATGTASLKNNSIPMPMAVQLGLGSTDVILGVAMHFKKGFSAAIGYQLPVFNQNQNGFDSAPFKNLETKNNLAQSENYFISSNLNRKGDVMARFDKVFVFSKLEINMGLLPIYHLGNDVVNNNKTTTQPIDGSHGLTLNANMGLRYSLNQKFEISAFGAAPLITRKSRPDGLTRSLIIFSGLTYKF